MVPAPTTWPRPALRWAAAWRGVTTSSPRAHTNLPARSSPPSGHPRPLGPARPRQGAAGGEHRHAGGFHPAVAQGNLATLLMEEGKLAEALATYEAVYRTFQEAGARQSDGRGAGADRQRSTRIRAVTTRPSNTRGAAGDWNESAATKKARPSACTSSPCSTGSRRTTRPRWPAARRRRRWTANWATRHWWRPPSTSRASSTTAWPAPRPTTRRRRGHRAAAFDRFTESLAIKRRIGNEAGTADSLGELGKLLQGRGADAEAIEAFNECVETQQRLGNPTKLGIGLEWLGIVHERQGQLAAALEKYQQALELCKQVHVAAAAADH